MYEAPYGKREIATLTHIYGMGVPRSAIFDFTGSKLAGYWGARRVRLDDDGSFVFDPDGIPALIIPCNRFGEEYDDNLRLNARFSRTFEPAPKFNLYGGLTLAYHFGRP